VTRIAAFVGVTLVAASGAAAQTRRPMPAAAAAPNGWASFTRGFDAFARQDSVVGGAAVFVRRGQVTAHHTFGWADRDGRAPIDTLSIFHYGSITKTLTAVAVMQLRDRGLLSLDDPITRYVPELREVRNPFGSMDDVTIRMLLSHSSGFQDPTWPYRRYERWEPFEPTRWEQLVAMMPYQRLRFPPGSRYGYSNPAFIYLARVIERLTGDAWQSYVYKNVWLPLGITESYFAATPWHLAPRRSNNYTVERDSAGRVHVAANGRDFDPGITIPNGGWNAPLRDLVTWVAWLTGMRGGDTLLRRATLEEMWRPVVVSDSGRGDAMGLSFFIRPRPGGGRVIGHTGSQAGFRAFVWFDPAGGDAVIAVVNTDNAAQPRESAAGWTRVMDSAIALLGT
jgi:CubicO group peptidase (beta-lactamase class C family)